MARDDRGRGEYRQRFPAGQVLANHTRVGVKREDKGPGEGLEEEAGEVGLERLTEPLHDLRQAERAAALSRSGGIVGSRHAGSAAPSSISVMQLVKGRRCHERCQVFRLHVDGTGEST